MDKHDSTSISAVEQEDSLDIDIDANLHQTEYNEEGGESALQDEVAQSFSLLSMESKRKEEEEKEEE